MRVSTSNPFNFGSANSRNMRGGVARPAEKYFAGFGSVASNEYVAVNLGTDDRLASQQLVGPISLHQKYGRVRFHTLIMWFHAPWWDAITPARLCDGPCAKLLTVAHSPGRV